jgi:hypothetical protein
VLARLQAELSLPEDPGRRGEPKTVAKSRIDVFMRTGEADMNGFGADCNTGTALDGELKSAPETGGFRTDPRPCVEDRSDILNGETG